MKTLKNIMILAFLGMAMLSVAQMQPARPACEEMPLKKAMMNSEIVQAMHSQLSATMVLQVERPGLYRASVVIKKHYITIYGTSAEWADFFNSKYENHPFAKSGKRHNPFSMKGWFGFGTASENQ